MIGKGADLDAEGLEPNEALAQLRPRDVGQAQDEEPQRERACLILSDSPV